MSGAVEQQPLPHSYRALVERIPGIVYAAAAGQHGAWLYASPQIETILGYSSDEWCASPSLWFERLHPDDRALALADEAASQETGALDSTYRMIARDGRVIWFQDRATLVEDELGASPYFQGVMLDITDRRLTEQELEVSRARLEQAQRLAHIGSWEWDVASDRVSWSDELYRIFGLERDGRELAYDDYLQLVHPDDRDFVETMIERAFADLEPFHYEFRVVRRDGEVRAVDARGEVLTDGRRKPVKMLGTAQDVTERRRAERRAELNASLASVVVSSALDCVITIDHAGIVREFNPAAERTFGYSRDEALGRDLAELIVPPALRSKHRQGLERAVKSHDTRIVGRRLELTGMRSDGSELPIELTLARTPDEPPQFIGYLRDISDRKRAEDALTHSHDQLQSIIDNSPSLIYAKDSSFHYLFANREFERVFGLDPGTAIGRTDEAILPTTMFERARSNDRWVLETGQTVEEEQIFVVGDEERTFLTQRFPLRDAEGAVYAVCAIATDITERKETEDELRREVEWSNRVREAVARGLFVLHSQPILHLSSNEVRQEELLVRMLGRRGVEDLVYPREFLPYAERFGLVQDIDRWVVFEAIKLARDRRVEVNISGRSIGDEKLIRIIETQLRSSAVEPSNIVFEITETAAAANLELSRQFAQRLTDLGCGFALDDFGTGYGSFTYLKHLPVTHLKIDLEFVRDLASDPSDQKVVRSIVSVAQNFGIRTIAEGVEDAETLEILRGLGVDYAQGYLIGKPRAL